MLLWKRSWNLTRMKTVENMMDQDDSIKHSVELLNEQLSQAME